jgi:hypothetical protein
MAKALNFNTIKKRFLPVTFADEKSTTIFIGLPTKAILTELMELNVDVNTMNEGGNFDAFDGLYEICVKVMNRNKGGVKITKEFLEEVLDFEEILIFLKEYMSFVGEIASQKN